MMQKSSLTPKSRINSFRYAFKGLRYGFKNQVNIWIHLVAAILVIVFGFYFQISIGEWIALFLCIALVIGAELLNTAIEHLVDLVSPEYHPLAGKVKDIAAAAVLVFSIASAAVGLLVFVPHFFEINLL